MDTEKLILETLQKVAKIEALIETDLKNIRSDVNRVETKLDSMSNKMEESSESISSIRIKMQELEVRVGDVEEEQESTNNKYDKCLYAFIFMLFSIAGYFIVPYFH